MPKIRFSLRSLMLLTLVVCVALWTWPAVKYWYEATPLKREVTQFNQASRVGILGFRCADLTENEVLKAVRERLDALKTTEEERRIYAWILATGRLPKDSKLSHELHYFVNPTRAPSSSFHALSLKVPCGTTIARVPIRKVPLIKYDAPPIHDPLENYYTDLIVW